MKIYPCVYILENKYKVVVASADEFICTLIAGGKEIKDSVGGLMRGDDVHSFLVDCDLLEKNGGYTVVCRKVIKRQAYYSKFGKPEEFYFNFSGGKYKGYPEQPFNLFYISDVHNLFEQTEKLADFARNKVDLQAIAFGGDLGEIENNKNAVDFCEFMYEMTKGEIPAIFCRGNHDTRGNYAPELPLYVGMNGYNGYFTFNYKGFNGIVLDCGEDKTDDCISYGGGAAFHEYRVKEKEFIGNIAREGRKFDVALCHIGFMLKTNMYAEFDIERELYSEWAESLNKIRPSLMVCGHTHERAFDLPCGNQIQPFAYPVLTGGSLSGKDITASLITFYKERIAVKSVDKSGVSDSGIVIDRTR